MFLIKAPVFVIRFKLEGSLRHVIQWAKSEVKTIPQLKREQRF